MKSELAKLTLCDLNNAIRKDFGDNDRMQIIPVTKVAENMREAILKNSPSPIEYAAPKPQEILAEDKLISTYPIRVQPEEITITPVGNVFQ